MTDFRPYIYFRNLIQQSKGISPEIPNEDDHFSRASSIIAIDEFLNEMSSLTGFQFILIDSVSGQLIDKYSDNLLENRYFSFYLLHRVKAGDAMDKEYTLIDVHTELLKILSRMFEDKSNHLFGLDHLDRNSIHYDSIGPLAHNWYGYSCSFMLLTAPNVFFDKNQWHDTTDQNMVDPDPGGGEIVVVGDEGVGGLGDLDPPR